MSLETDVTLKYIYSGGRACRHYNQQ